MPACLAVKEDRKTINEMEKIAETKNEKNNKENEIDLKTKLVSYVVTGTDIYAELDIMAAKVGGALLTALVPEVLAKICGGLLLSPAFDLFIKVQKNIVKWIEKRGAVIIGVNEEDIFIYDFEQNKRIPAFENGKSNSANFIKGITGETFNDIVDGTVKSVAESIPDTIDSKKELPEKSVVTKEQTER